MNLSSFARLLLAALAAFIFSGLYYGLVVGATWRELSGASDAAGAMALWQPLAQFARNLVVAAALTVVFRRASITSLRSAIGLSTVLWLGFQAMAIAGSVIHEQYPLALYAIHTVDQLGTMLVMAFCLVFRWTPRRQSAVARAGAR